ncbi:MAG: hypothetical protein KBT48_00020 [Firmicutes bacterium]|nr:hypothetical protein [Bacillota bacterium]
MKNKLCKFMLAMGMALSLLACTNSIPKEEKEVEQVAGAWTFNESAQANLPEDEQMMFEEVVKDYKPVALLATQVVSGENYCFLAEKDSTYALVKIYKNLEGKSELLNVQELKVGEMETGLVGGWNVAENTYACPSRVDMDILYKAQKEAKVGNFELIACLETQPVAGTNYCYLCKETTENKLVILTVYENLDGQAEIKNIVDLSIA